MSAFPQNRPPLLGALWFCGVVGGGVTKRECREGRVPGRREHSHGQQSQSQQAHGQARSCQRTPCSLCSSVTLTITEHPLGIQLWARHWEHIYKLTLSLHKPWEIFTLKTTENEVDIALLITIIRLPSKKSLLHQWSEVTILAPTQSWVVCRQWTSLFPLWSSVSSPVNRNFFF